MGKSTPSTERKIAQAMKARLLGEARAQWERKNPKSLWNGAVSRSVERDVDRHVAKVMARHGGKVPWHWHI